MPNTNQSGTNILGDTGNANVKAGQVDSNGYILTGTVLGTPPTTADWFQKGCVLTQTDSGSGGPVTWTNTGTTAAPVWNSGSMVLKTTLSSVQIKNLNGTPVVIAPAPGAGKAVLLEDVSFYNSFGTVAYTGNSIEVRYTDGSGAKAITDIASAFLSSTTSTMVVETALSTNVTAVLNASLVAVVATANPATGDGTIVVTAKYRIAETS